jgi:hypothetical protein
MTSAPDEPEDAMTDLTEIIASWRENGTPGPWQGQDGTATWVMADHLHVATIPRAGDGDWSPANAAFIAAAPDMADRIEALETLLTEIRDLTVERRDHATMDEADAVMRWTLWEAVLEDIKEVLGEQE